MLRTLAYPYEAQEAKVLDRYGNFRGKIPLKTGENQLPITPYGCYLQDSLGNVFVIYDGEGVLEFSDCLRHYDFSTLEPMGVELALNGEIPLNDSTKEWLEVSAGVYATVQFTLSLNEWGGRKNVEGQIISINLDKQRQIC